MQQTTKKTADTNGKHEHLNSLHFNNLTIKCNRDGKHSSQTWSCIRLISGLITIAVFLVIKGGNW
jgi:hypothetical protein